MLGSFIRLVDYMLVEALVDRTIGSVEEIVAMLEAPQASAEKTHKVCSPNQQSGIINPTPGCPIVILDANCAVYFLPCYIRTCSHVLGVQHDMYELLQVCFFDLGLVPFGVMQQHGVMSMMSFIELWLCHYAGGVPYNSVLC